MYENVYLIASLDTYSYKYVFYNYVYVCNYTMLLNVFDKMCIIGENVL